MSRSVRKDIHSLRGSSDGTAVASIQEVDLERPSSLIQNGYAPVIAPALVDMAKEKQAGLGVADSFLPSSSALARFSYKAVQAPSVSSPPPVMVPLDRAVEPEPAHRAPHGIIPKGHRQLWGWLILRLHGLGQNDYTLFLKNTSPCISLP